MLFNSFSFFLFYLGVFVIYWAFRKTYRAQNAILLAASLFFYGWWDVRFLFLFILTTVVDFFCALMIERGEVHRRQRWVAGSILSLAAFACLTVHWAAFRLVRSGLHVSATVDARAIFSPSIRGWLPFLFTCLAVLCVGLAYNRAAAVPGDRRRRLFLAASVTSNLGVLGFFKYYNFFADSLAEVVARTFGVHVGHLTLNVILPVGISFYTFQSLAYTIDVYRRKVPALERYMSLATCLSFFPLLVAGPIERPGHFFPQFFRLRSLSSDFWREGIWLIVWGLFKKMVVADQMAKIVALTFAPYDGVAPSQVIPTDGLRLLLGLYAFAIQIYGDFSGYSDIARGTARLLGFDVMRNFNLPYFAISPSDFWQRWHISLSSWLRDYLYISLGGNRRGTLITYRNLFLTMLLGGLWHGAAWTYVLWGAYHGALLIVYRLFSPSRERSMSTAALQPSRHARMDCAAAPGFAVLPLFTRVVGRVLLIAIMFHLTCVGWLFFRATNLKTISVFLNSIVFHPAWSPEAAAIGKDILFYGWLLMAFQVAQLWSGTLDPMRHWHWFVRLNVWILVVMSIVCFSSSEPSSFIYFAF